MSLLDLQIRFAQDAALLIQEAAVLGYQVTLGEAWRSPEQAAWNQEHGLGIANSLHMDKLAIDLNLFHTVDGKRLYISDGTGHTELGSWWKSLGPDHRWGGDFTKQDPNHYSISPGDGRA
jgi:hypothetical protein